MLNKPQDKKPNITFEDIMSNPRKYGMPTFDEFAKDPDKYRERKDFILESADKSTQTFRNLVKKQYYIIAGHRVKSLEQVQRIAKEEGIELTELEMQPQIEPCYDGSGKCNIIVRFRKKAKGLVQL